MSNYGESYYLEELEEMKKENQCQECKHLKKKIELNIKNKLMNEIQKLKQQLAEKEDSIKYLKGIKRYDIGEMITANIKLKQSQNQTAIAELEKLKNYLPNIALDIPDMVSYRYLKKQIDQQIRVLKGESR